MRQSNRYGGKNAKAGRPARGFLGCKRACTSVCAPYAYARARSLYHEYEVTVWWATPVELASALARLLRMQQINATELTAARRLVADLSDTWWMIQPSDVLQANALALVDQYDLRAAASLQLAAAIEWCEDRPHGRVFLTADQRLREAALLCGFDTEHL
jgi:predicted nucleic acid-binding protein